MTTPAGDAAPTPTPLADAAARRRIADGLDETLFVTAGAGSGKTTMLVRRLVAILCDAADEVGIRNIAAITFTESAAAELSVRLRAALEDVIQTEPGTERATRARRAIHDFGQAAITTLHGFAFRLIAEHVFAVGVPPRFRVRSGAESSLALAEEVRAFLDDAIDDAVLAAWLGRAFDLGLSRDKLAELAAKLHDDLDRTLAAADRMQAAGTVDGTAGVPPRLPPPLAVAEVVAAFAAFSDRLDECSDPADTIMTTIAPRAVRARAELDTALEDGDDAVLAWARIWEADKLCSTRRYGKKTSWPDIDAVRADLAALADSIRGLVEGQRRAVLAELLDRLQRRTVHAAHARWRRGDLEFTDLLVLARNLLRDDAAVRAELHARYRYVFVDEFQDTDPLQAEIALALTSPPDGTHPVPGRLFVVGDAQQSIYRFRRADVDAFVAMRDRVGGTHVTLQTNFRSVPGICAWVNDTFGRLLDPGLFVALTPHRPNAPGIPELHDTGRPTSVVWTFGAEHPAPGAAEAARVADARDVALLVRRLHDGPSAGAPDPTPPRAFAFGDIAILVPDRTIVRTLEAALAAAGIPYRIESKTLMYATATVTEVWLLLRALVDAGDAAAIVATLRGPAFGCTDAELVDYAAAGGRWRLSARPPATLPTDHPVPRALARLNDLANHIAERGVADAVQSIVTELHLAETYAVDVRPRDAWRRLRFVVDQARAFESDGGRSVERFVRWLETQREAQVRVDETLLPESDDDAVRIQTIHGAKGLEYPAVVLCGLSTRTRVTAPSLLWDPDGTAQVRLSAAGARGQRFATPGWEDAAAGETAAIAAERHRLLYVAATRARDVLAVSTHRVAVAANSSASPTLATTLAGIVDAQLADAEAGDTAAVITRCDWLDAAAIPARYAVADPAGRSVPQPDPPPVGIEPTDLALPRAVWQERRAEAVADLRSEPVVAPTTLANTATFPGFAVPPEYDGPDLEPWDDPGVMPERRLGAKGAAVGRAVHKLLEGIDLTAGAGDVDALAQYMSADERHPEVADTVARFARHALASPIMAAAQAAPRSWREIYVAATIEGTLIEGYIDLLYEDPAGGLVVVDYKTNRITGDMHELQLRYRVQLAAYAAVVEAATGADVVGCHLLFCATDPAVVVPLEGELLRDSISLVHDAARQRAEARPLD